MIPRIESVLCIHCLYGNNRLGCCAIMHKRCARIPKYDSYEEYGIARPRRDEVV